jgi:hypothetical protein
VKVIKHLRNLKLVYVGLTADNVGDSQGYAVKYLIVLAYQEGKGGLDDPPNLLVVGRSKH